METACATTDPKSAVLYTHMDKLLVDFGYKSLELFASKPPAGADESHNTLHDLAKNLVQFMKEV